jgi:hypothetical protein
MNLGMGVGCIDDELNCIQMCDRLLVEVMDSLFSHFLLGLQIKIMHCQCTVSYNKSCIRWFS